ncbi:hypothetical protein EIP86_010050 [Pleurotus ostreatoroseus]|nr:hypothetical protein EIP86_010050 [Pleurotus ostreatoroseus]
MCPLADYFAATAGIYVSSWLVRVLHIFFNGVCPGVTLEVLPEDMIKITIPTTASWRTGQHLSVRFFDLGVYAASSHPFTVASLPKADSKGAIHIIQMYARIRNGITARLGAAARNGRLKTSSVMLDGSYGGFESNLRVYNRALRLGGGSGIAFIVPLLLDPVRSQKATRLNAVRCTSCGQCAHAVRSSWKFDAARADRRT